MPPTQHPPDMEWQDGTPYSPAFDDTYFSRENGLAETRHVFLKGNNLPSTWSDSKSFTIAETGFGTGLNFAATWALWRETGPPEGWLNYLSVEGFPLPNDAMSKALGHWPELKSISERIASSWPAPRRGFHRLHFDEDRISLTLLFGDVVSMLRATTARVDAWFLDGFAPSRNPDMWSEPVFREMARLSRPGATVATFTVAGMARRGLEGAGFAVEKTTGFGRKREMLTGHYAGPRQVSERSPWYQLPSRQWPGSALVVGGGIAGACLAYAFSRRKVPTKILDVEQDGPEQSRALPAAALTPRLTLDTTAAGQLYAASHQHAAQVYGALDRSPLQVRGSLQLAMSIEDEHRFDRLADGQALPTSLARRVGVAEASELVGIDLARGGIWFPAGGSVAPSLLLEDLCHGATQVRGRPVARIEQDGRRWLALDASGERLGEADICILAAPPAVTALPETGWLPMEWTRGQVTLLPAANTPSLRAAVSFGGYAAPLADGRLCLGSTFEKLAATPNSRPRLRPADHNEVLQAARDALGSLVPPSPPAGSIGFAGVRAATPDRMPVAGPVCERDGFLSSYPGLRRGDKHAPGPAPPYIDGLYVLTALGSRGFTTSPILAELIASMTCGEPLPMENDLVEAILPQRFLVRALRRGTA